MGYKKYQDNYLNKDRPERKDHFLESSEYRQDGKPRTPIPVITAEAERWLVLRHFNEEGLCNAEQEGMYRYYLRDQVRDALERNPMCIGNENFLVVMRGCHFEGEEENREMYEATFRFQYQLDCENDMLTLSRLEVTMKGVTTRYTPQKFADLPFVNECYEQINHQLSLPIDQRLKIAREIINTPPAQQQERRLRPLKRS